MSSIFVAPYQELLPIARGLANSGHRIITINQQFQQALTNMDVKEPVALLGPDIPPETRSATATMAAEIIRNMPYPLPGDGVSPAVAAFVDNNLSGYFMTRLNDMIFTVAALDHAKPSLAILHNDVEPWMRIVALWAKARGVPCLHIPHAIYLENSERGVPGTDIHDIITSSHIAVSGPYQAAWYSERAKLQGVKPKIIVTGLPQFDRLARPRMDRAQSHYLLKLDPKRPVVTYFSSWRQDTNLLGCHDGIEETYQHFLSAAARLGPSYQYIIKLHPRAGQQSHQWHAKLAQESGIAAVLAPEHLDVVLNSSDLLITVGPSNVVIEAAMVGMARLVCVGAGAFPNDDVIVKGESSPETIASIITSTLSQPVPDYTSFLSKYVPFRDGENSARIIQLALDLVKG